MRVEWAYGQWVHRHADAGIDPREFHTFLSQWYDQGFELAHVVSLAGHEPGLTILLHYFRREVATG